VYALRLLLQPTAGLTFRRVPFASTQMLTYPFAPAPTLSGYLERLARLRRGEDLPETALNERTPPTIALPSAYRVLGAYPRDDAYRVHRTARQGPRDLGHTAFSRIHRQDARPNENFQLYAWEYLLVEQLVGWVVHPEKAALDDLAETRNYGCKLGKEGFAYVADATVEELTATTGGRPSVAVPAEAVGMAPATVYPAYRFDREGERITGYVPLRVALVDAPLATEGYATPAGDFLPTASIDYL
jgi:hypothetical protein